MTSTLNSKFIEHPKGCSFYFLEVKQSKKSREKYYRITSPEYAKAAGSVDITLCMSAAPVATEYLLYTYIIQRKELIGQIHPKIEF